MTHRDEQVRHPGLVLAPRVTILCAAALDVACGAVGDHAAEEEGVEPGEGAAEAGDEPPADGEVGVAGVVDLAGEAVPAVDEDGVAARRRDGRRVAHRLPRQLREGPARHEGAALRGPEAVLLAVAAVPHPVDEEVREVQRRERVRVPPVRRRRLVGQVDGAVAVRQRHAGQVPEDEHEPPLLVVHVPGGDDELLAFGARVGVQVVRHDDEADLAADVAVLLILARRGAAREQEQDEPGQAHLEEHLKVEDAEHARVQLRAHEEVVDGVSRHPVRGPAGKGRDVGHDADEEAREDRDRHERAELVDDGVQREQAREVQPSGQGDGRVEGRVGRAVVLHLLATIVSERLAVGPDAGEETVAGALEDEECPVYGPGPGVRESSGVDKLEEVLGKLAPALVGRPRWELAVVVGRPYPHIPHQEGEAKHHGRCAQGAAELKLSRVVDLGVQPSLPTVDHVFPGVAISVAISVAIGMTVAVGSTLQFLGGAVGLDLWIRAQQLLWRGGGLGGHVIFLDVLDEFGSAAPPESAFALGTLGRRARIAVEVGTVGGGLGLAARGTVTRRFNHALEEFLLPFRKSVNAGFHVSFRPECVGTGWAQESNQSTKMPASLPDKHSVQVGAFSLHLSVPKPHGDTMQMMEKNWTLWLYFWLKLTSASV